MNELMTNILISTQIVAVIYLPINNIKMLHRPTFNRARMRNQRQEKHLQKDLMKSQRVCHQMDTKAVCLYCGSLYFS